MLESTNVGYVGTPDAMARQHPHSSHARPAAPLAEGQITMQDIEVGSQRALEQAREIDERLAAILMRLRGPRPSAVAGEHPKDKLDRGQLECIGNAIGAAVTTQKVALVQIGEIETLLGL